MTLDDAAADGQPHASAIIRASPMQPLERGKDTVEILLVETDAVVAHFQAAYRLGHVAIARGLLLQMPDEFDHRRHVRLVEFERVADKVLQELVHLRRVGLDGGQVADRDAPVGLFDLHLQIREDVGHDGVEIDPAERADLGRDTGIGQQVGESPDIRAAASCIRSR